ncbi:hypothetical protein AGMMS49974_11050 [Deltaproteobacteria bacterium]|nr:hypothetical protein AGMMS49974_11050 [Deltaproteobacteria bacterium]
MKVSQILTSVWKARGVSFQVWSKADQGNPQLSGEASAPAVWRVNLLQAFLTALAQKDPEPLQNADGASHSAAAYDMPQGKAILVALLFGDRRFIRQQTMNNFAAATLAHSLALSGQHLSVAGLFGLICVLAAGPSVRAALSQTAAFRLRRVGSLPAGACLSLDRQCASLACLGKLHAFCFGSLAHAPSSAHHA